jgi:hypothetical protein
MKIGITVFLKPFLAVLLPACDEMKSYISIYQDSEDDTFSVKVVGSDNWDELSGLSEQEAIDEADAIQAETSLKIVKDY